MSGYFNNPTTNWNVPGPVRGGINSVTNPIGTVKNSGRDLSASTKKAGLQASQNKGALIGGAVAGPWGTILGAQSDPNGIVKPVTDKIQEQIGTKSADIAGKMGLGQAKTDDSSTALPSLGSILGQIPGANGPGGGGAGGGPVSPVNWNNVQAQQLNTADQGQMRANQNALIAQLQGQANGTGPSLAQTQLQSAKDQNIASAMALGASQHGLTAGQGLRNISNQTTTANQMAGQQSAQLRLQEQQNAQNQLGSVVGSARAQDIGLAQSQADLSQQAAIANSQGQLGAATTTGAQTLQEQQMKNQMIQSQLSAGVSLAQAQLNANTQLEALKASNYNAQQTRMANFLGGAGSAIMAIGAAA